MPLTLAELKLALIVPSFAPTSPPTKSLPVMLPPVKLKLRIEPVAAKYAIKPTLLAVGRLIVSPEMVCPRPFNWP